MFQLKPISRESIPEALVKAGRYRFLNEAWLAESICLDILEVDPENHEAIVLLILAITDQFDSSPVVDAKQASQYLHRLKNEYEKHYYAGIICERQGNSVLRRGIPDSNSIAFEWLQDAMEYFEKAEKLRSGRNDDAILRWNTCARLIMKNHLEPKNEKYVEPMLE